MGKLYKYLCATFFRMELACRAMTIRFRYAYNLLRIRKLCGKRKVRVAFLVNDISKWKAQSLYDLMNRTTQYEAFIVLTFADRDWSLADEKMHEKYEKNRAFFTARGISVIDGYDFATKRVVLINDLNCDIVWYQQPWDYAENQRPNVASLWALTCYIPYFVANYGDFNMDYGQQFHRDLWRHFILNRKWEHMYSKRGHWWLYSGKLLGLGHTGLDFIVNSRNPLQCSEYIIYAPHWSFDWPGNENSENYSTFLWTGRPMLEYAKAHRQVKWVFKPHPTLKRVLYSSRAWTADEIESYYNAWGELGTVCETGDYQDLFLHSKAMVTDCGSFLTEYFATGKPLIHLLSPTVKLKPLAPSKKMFDSFYKVCDLEELTRVLDDVVLENNDPKYNERQLLLRDMHIGENSAASNILEYLNMVLGMN